MNRRTLDAFHEAGHALAAVCLGIPLEAVSLRPGQRFSAVTFFGPVVAKSLSDDEARIVVTLSGRPAETMAEPLPEIQLPIDADRLAILALERRAPAAFVQVMAGEADDNDDILGDEQSAYVRSFTIAGSDASIAAVHLNYLRVRALRTVELHRRALRAIAEALYARTVLTGAEVEAIVRSFRCVCHADWGPPSAFASGTPAA